MPVFRQSKVAIRFRFIFYFSFDFLLKMVKTRSHKNLTHTKTVRVSNLSNIKEIIKPCSILLEKIDIRKFHSKSDIVRVLPVRSVRMKKKIISIDKSIEKKITSTAVMKQTKIKGKKLDAIAVGDYVLARQKYSVPWPAKILTIKSKFVNVYFYGDGRKGPVKREEIYSFSDSHDVILGCLRRNIPAYLKGIRELEMISNIPPALSITN